MATRALTHTGALVRGLSSDFALKALRRPAAAGAPAPAPIDAALAARQHAAYVAALASCLPAGGVTALPALEGAPDAVFVEDAAVVVGGRALLARSGAAARREEAASVGEALRARGVACVALAPPGTLDGGDVLWTGREFFCGLGARTNEVGLEALRAAFPGARVTGVPLGALGAGARRAARARLAHPTARLISDGEGEEPPPLHLKSLLSVVGPDTLAVADTPLGNAVAMHLQQHSGVPTGVRRAGGRLAFVLVPPAAAPAANALLVNGTLIVRAAEEHAEGAAELRRYAKDTGLKVLEVNMSEFAKADGALTCCSILL
jgi:dimethylargininase